jgi:hypothetical protein
MAVTETTHGSCKKIVWAWTSDTSGDAEEVTAEAYDGKLVGLTTIPDAVAAPTVDYDIVVTDSGGHDVLLGAGADRHTSATEHVAEASLAAVAASKLTLTVSAAGSEKEGVVVLYVR